MLRPEDNELLVRIGPGTAMGELFRRFWTPVMVPEEVAEPDGTHRLVGVGLGLFDDAEGLVQVTGSSLRAGQRVVVPST